MLYAQMKADVATSLEKMASLAKRATGKGKKTYSIIVSASKRPVKVTAPSTLKSYLDSVMKDYAMAAQKSYTATVDELFVGSTAASITGFDVKQMTAGTPQDNGGSSNGGLSWSDTDSGGVLFDVGCGAARYWPDLPWCVLGDGFASYTYGKKLQAVNAAPATASNWQTLTTGIALWNQFGTGDSAITPLTTTGTQDYTTLLTTLTGANAKRLKCLLRHYEFFTTMVQCLSHGLAMLMNADSGCKAADLAANRYHCLCRRRAKYLITQSAPIAKISGRVITKVLADDASMDVLAGTGVNESAAFVLESPEAAECFCELHFPGMPFEECIEEMPAEAWEEMESEEACEHLERMHEEEEYEEEEWR